MENFSGLMHTDDGQRVEKQEAGGVFLGFVYFLVQGSRNCCHVCLLA